MKPIHFLENDYECPGSDDSIDYGRDQLSRYFNATDTDQEAMKIHYQFHLMDKDEALKIVFNPNNILATWSVYCQGSEQTFCEFLASAGRNEVKDVILLDLSGGAVKWLNRNIKDLEDDTAAIIAAINTNYILTIDSENKAPGFKSARIKIEPKGLYDDWVTLIPYNKKILKPSKLN